MVMSEVNEAERWYGRLFMYRLAHAVFSGEPDETLLGTLASENCRSTLRTLAGEYPAAVPLADYAEGLSATCDLHVEAAACLSTYNRVVAGLGSRRASHPWESAYTSCKKLLMQPETLEVRGAYRAWGYLPKMYMRVPDDHLSLECAFLAELAQRTIQAAEEGEGDGLSRLVAAQWAFLQNHLLRWLGEYAADLHEDAPDSLYDRAAQALALYAAEDAFFLREWDRAQ